VNCAGKGQRTFIHKQHFHGLCVDLCVCVWWGREGGICEYYVGGHAPHVCVCMCVFASVREGMKWLGRAGKEEGGGFL
jgi:hypothetical protein